MKEQAQAAIANLEAFDSKYLMTDDERVALTIVREALEDIAKSGDISPTVEGQAHKLRLWRRVAVSYFHPTSPRPPAAARPQIPQNPKAG